MTGHESAIAFSGRAEGQPSLFLACTSNNCLQIIEEEMDRRSRARMLRRQMDNRDSWLSFHESMHKTHLRIAAEHADKRSRLMAESGFDPDTSPGPEAAFNRTANGGGGGCDH